MTWGRWGKKYSKNEMIALINYCLEHQITSFDHADIYGGYTNETDFGNAFIESKIDRERIQLISKCGIQYLCDNRTNKVKHYNFNKEYIIWSAETSLKNLKTDYLDLFLLHRPSPLMHPNEIAEAFSQLKTQGKIKNFGVSNFTPSQVELISTSCDIKVNQIEFSLTQHSAMYNGALDQMMTKSIVPMAWSPLGAIFKEDTAQTQRIKKLLKALTTVYNASEDQLLLAWVLNHPSKIHPVIGTTNNKRIKAAIEAVDIKLDIEDWFLILEASQGHEVP
jgi:predicted oxidoreductase